MSKMQYPKIYLDEYIYGGRTGIDFDERRIDELCEADAIIDSYEDGLEDRFVDTEKGDKHTIEKLRQLKATADKTKSYTDIKSYDSYAECVFHEKYNMISSFAFTAFVSKSKDLTIESKLKFELAIARFQDLWEHYVYAKKLWFDSKCSLPELSDEEEN